MSKRKTKYNNQEQLKKKKKWEYDPILHVELSPVAVPKPPAD